MADSIRIKLPDGSEKEVPRGTTALDIARSISPRLADAAIVAKIVLSSNGHGSGGPGGEGVQRKKKAPRRGQKRGVTRPLERRAEVRNTPPPRARAPHGAA